MTTKTGFPMPSTAQTADILNELLRGELAAVETYETVLWRFAEGSIVAAKLTAIRDEHAESVHILQESVERYGGMPTDGLVGVWRSFGTAVTGGSVTVGSLTVLAALQQGEQECIVDCREALDNGVPAECRDMILNDLLPRCEEHFAILDDLRAQTELA